MTTTYHHGDLRTAVLRAAAEMIAQDGAEQFSLRAVAQALGVSHTAPRHHFGSREGVFTALAVEGFELMAAELDGAASFSAVGTAYVRFSVAHPGHFAVMHRPDLLDHDDPALVAAQRRTGEQLQAGAAAQSDGTPAELAIASIAAWSLVHGLAVLTLSGALATLQERAGGDLQSVAERTTRLLFASAPSTPQPEGDSR